MTAAGGGALPTGLTGRVVVVTGGSTGIGRAAGAAFARAGMRVVLASRRIEAGEQAAAEIKEAGGDACFLPCDVTDPAQVERLFAAVRGTYGTVHHAFNNAGVPGDGRLVDLTPDQFDATFAVNTRGLWLCLREELRLMAAQGFGSIVNTTSVHGQRTVFPGIGAYVTSKHAAAALTRVAALEHARDGVRVNAVAPGPIETEMLAASEAAVGGATTWRGLIPSGVIGTPEQVADVVLWLFSDASSYVNGQVVAVDGGFLAV
ncbi:SDR family NAD(P)-dependent oxidoreductase [Kitasatospora kifunensis]|uniref:NAD(P)-dependent dehydrogenase (Short-subunit alcohol dehydrogenase family) n=1 Tax=Kitasatospora kifunensis TaxID=58351 RepID=A0A7W7R9U5_KITKI|nr:SDR family oxidoreductase [Kitasatospora kifunensis]MBB4928029.1 NAD(P)-dependent dehydrogenase (short-subunit alcohol dehydrogenase family) [Kitasatospora kifunensis]